jgi:hypothetical protein
MEEIKRIEKKYEFTFLNDIDKNKIIDLFDNDIIIEENNDDKYWNYVGIYYEKKIKDYNLIKKYFSAMLVKLDKNSYLSTNGTFHFAKYYTTRTKLYKHTVSELIKYYMTIDFNIKIILNTNFISQYYNHIFDCNSYFLSTYNIINIKKLYYSLIHLDYCD